MGNPIMKHHLETWIEKYLHSGMDRRVPFPDNPDFLRNIADYSHINTSFFCKKRGKPIPRDEFIRGSTLFKGLSLSLNAFNARLRIYLLPTLFDKPAPGCTSSSSDEDCFQRTATPLCRLFRKSTLPVPRILFLYSLL